MCYASMSGCHRNLLMSVLRDSKNHFLNTAQQTFYKYQAKPENPKYKRPTTEAHRKPNNASRDFLTINWSIGTRQINMTETRYLLSSNGHGPERLQKIHKKDVVLIIRLIINDSTFTPMFSGQTLRATSLRTFRSYLRLVVDKRHNKIRKK